MVRGCIGILEDRHGAITVKLLTTTARCAWSWMRGRCRKSFPSRECCSSDECGGKQPKQGKAIGAIKDIHQQREESSRARGMLASRAKSESFAYRGGQSRTTGHKEEEENRWEDGRPGGGTGSQLQNRSPNYAPNDSGQKERTFKITRVQHITTTSMLLANSHFFDWVLRRSAVEGYEPYGAGVKQSQNNFCNEKRAVVSTLHFGPQHISIVNCNVSVILLKTNLNNASFLNNFLIKLPTTMQGSVLKRKLNVALLCEIGVL